VEKRPVTTVINTLSPTERLKKLDWKDWIVFIVKVLAEAFFLFLFFSVFF